MLQLPSAGTSTLPIGVVPSYSVTVEPATPVPLSFGSVSSVRWLVGRSLWMLPTLSVMLRMTGAAGACVSTVIVTTVGEVVTLPAISEANTVKLCTRSVSGAPSGTV